MAPHCVELDDAQYLIGAVVVQQDLETFRNRQVSKVNDRRRRRGATTRSRRFRRFFWA